MGGKADCIEFLSLHPGAPAVAKKRYNNVVPRVSPAFSIAFVLVSPLLLVVGDRKMFDG